jgi:hypothetical protein
MLERLTAADFEPLCGTGFGADLPAAPGVGLELIEVRALREPPARSGRPPLRRPFSLTFRARTPVHIPQGTYPLTHDRLGRLDVFLVPIGRDPDGLLLEAVFA